MAIWEAQRRLSVKPGSSRDETPSAPPAKGVSSPPGASPPSPATTSETAEEAPIFSFRAWLGSWEMLCPTTRFPTFLPALSLPCTGPSGQAASGLRCLPLSSRELPRRPSIWTQPLSGRPSWVTSPTVDPPALYRGREGGREEWREGWRDGREEKLSLAPKSVPLPSCPLSFGGSRLSTRQALNKAHHCVGLFFPYIAAPLSHVTGHDSPVDSFC